jgi:hypothetical protein
MCGERPHTTHRTGTAPGSDETSAVMGRTPFIKPAKPVDRDTDRVAKGTTSTFKSLFTSVRQHRGMPDARRHPHKPAENPKRQPSLRAEVGGTRVSHPGHVRLGGEATVDDERLAGDP